MHIAVLDLKTSTGDQLECSLCLDQDPINRGYEANKLYSNWSSINVIPLQLCQPLKEKGLSF